MTIGFPKTLGMLLGAGLCIVSASFGQTTLTLVNGAGADGGDTINGIYTSPYEMSLNTGSGPVTVSMDCDDWADSISDGQSWYVQGTALSAITGGGTNSPSQPALPVNTNVYWGSDSAPVSYDDNTPSLTFQLTQEEKYVAAVYLAVELNNHTLTNTQRGDLSLALWDIFNPTTVDGGYGSPNSNIGTDPAAQADVLAAINYGQDYSGGSVDGYTATVYTPLASENGSYSLPAETLGSGIAPGTATGRPQEFIALTYMPEPSTWAFLGFDFASAGIVGLYFLRRKSRVRS